MQREPHIHHQDGELLVLLLPHLLRLVLNHHLLKVLVIVINIFITTIILKMIQILNNIAIKT